MQSVPPGTYEDPSRKQRRSSPWLFLVALGLGLASFLALVGGIFGFAAEGTQAEDLQRVQVPGSGTFEVAEAGSFTIFYESSQYVDTGVCERRTRRINDRTRTELVCDEDLLAQAAAPPVVRPEGGDSIPVVDPGGTLVGFDLDEHLPVWAFTADEPGTYEIELDDAPLGTEAIAVGRDSDGAPGWAAVLLLLFLVFGAASFCVLVAAVIRALLRASKRKAAPPVTSWAPPPGGPPPPAAGSPPPGPAPPGGQPF